MSEDTESAFLLFQMCERFDSSLKVFAIKSRIMSVITHMCTVIWGGRKGCVLKMRSLDVAQAGFDLEGDFPVFLSLV